MNLLAISTLNCILEHLAPLLIENVLSHLFVEKKYDVALRNELNDLRQEMSGICMVDEFSKFAKLQRKYNKLKTTLKNNLNQRLHWKIKLQFILIYIFRALNGIFILSLLYMYKSEPVIILPKGTLWPIQNLLSWPSQHESAISLIVWIVIARIGLSACKKLDV